MTDIAFVKPQIIVISSVAPELTSAGQVILHRHLSNLTDWEVSVISNPYQFTNSVKDRWQTRLIRRLEYTRFHRLSYDLQVLDQGKSWLNIVNDAQKLYTKDIQNSIVLTVAHGDGCWAAQSFAQKYKLPLVSIFHDWWPDIPNIHRPLKSLLLQRFRQLYLKSDLTLCVSEGMQEALGEHNNSSVLYPIPEHLNNVAPFTASQKTNPVEFLKVIYFGNLYDYADDLGNLLNLTKSNSKVRVEVRGSNPNWTTEFKQEMRDRNLWLDFAPRKDLNNWSISADAFLVVMSFDPNLQKRMETSFPSKLPEYAQFGKPIVIWGPEYCSAIKWGKTGDRAVCITDKDPKTLVTALENLQQQPNLLKHYSQEAKFASQNEFNPVIIQNQFLESMQNILQ
ncbi:glycosyltransferase [Pseudanabaena sp. FACHB-1277]|uniref:Glycosyltransferase n=1 Tax=Pseudanabaena cinerea FACHB-1277 TaxID=2949581 RepID=A0A926UUH4_9CYAN|nr:glycosyltransferase [Pseudanabaena cinerea]MBD2150280.1 glycosyltransferase [Pseudanabaena cinerea FACHB-1277]